MLIPDELPPPNIVAGILIPGSSEAAGLQSIRRLERPPIHRYVLARELFVSVLKGRPLAWALEQAAASRLADQRLQAAALLNACNSFLTAHQGTFVCDAPKTFWSAGRELRLPNLYGAIVEIDSRQCATYFHFWKGELPDGRARLIKSAVQEALWRSPGFSGIETSLITAPFIDVLKRRSYRRIQCASLRAEPEELEEFGIRLSELWALYHQRNPLRSWR